MEYLNQLIDFVVHVDVHLNELILAYGSWTYAILFAIIFCETGLVVTPFLPGDSLLFAAGALAASGPLDGVWLFVLLSIAAIIGNTVNYWIGYTLGPSVLKKKLRFLNTSHLDRAHAFYEKHGGKTIIVARFLPIIRTFAPFVAGIALMNHGRFMFYNIVAGIGWVGIFVGGGYYFGNLPVVKSNFSIVILAIIVLSMAPAVIEVVRHKSKKQSTAPEKPIP
ncbi:MAG TPA: DedA family protein [Bacteroidota bacterium]|nr:DedA family protein [Bacteroidota bacterium]